MRYLPLLALVLPLYALAQIADEPTRIQWEGPTTYESGEPLIREGEIEEYRLYCRPTDGEYGEPYAFAGMSDSGEHTATRQEVLGQPGRYVCYLTAVAIGGAESLPSNEVALNWLGRPSPVQILVLE